MRVAVIAGGELKSSSKIIEKIENIEYDLVIAVDGGYDNAKKLKIEPDVLIGDLDSVTDNNFEGKIFKYNPEKDETDLMLACEYEKNATSIDILTATGNRLDHFLVNLSVLENLQNNGISARIIDEKNIITVLKGKQKFINLSKYVSVIPITPEIELSCENLMYKADKLIVKRDKIISVSNESNADEFVIDVSSGCAYIIQSND